MYPKRAQTRVRAHIHQNQAPLSFHERLREHYDSLDSGFVAAAEAAKFIATMQREHPQEVLEWMRTNAETFCARELSDIMRRRRQLVARRAQARAFAAAASMAAAGDLEALGAFSLDYAIDERNTRKKVKDMTGRDHLYVAIRYEASGKHALLLAEFHRVIARKLGDRSTAEVYPEILYEQMFASILGRGDASAIQAA